REDCHCILVEHYENPRFDMTAILGRLIGVPVFGMFAAVASSQSWWRRPMRFLALRSCAGLAICAGEEARRVVEQYNFPKGKIAQFYSPIAVSFGYQSVKKERGYSLGIPADAKVVIYHGRIEIWTKGLDVLVDAWDQICRDNPDQDLRLMLIGT